MALRPGDWLRGNREQAPAAKLLRSDRMDNLLASAAHLAVDGGGLVADEIVVLYLALDESDAATAEALLRRICDSFPSPYVEEIWWNAGHDESLIPRLKRLRVRARVVDREACEPELHALYEQSVFARSSTDFAKWAERAQRDRVLAFPLVGARARVLLEWPGDPPAVVPTVTVDEVPRPAEETVPSQRPIELGVGEHTIVVYASGEYEPWELRVRVTGREETGTAEVTGPRQAVLPAGRELVVPVVLARRAPRVKVDVVLLPSVVEVAAKLDGQPWEQVPIAREVALAVGEHTLEAQAAGYPRQSWPFTVEADQVNRAAFVFRLRYGNTTEADVAGYLHRLEPLGDGHDHIPLRFGSNLIGCWSKLWEGEYDIPLRSRYASRWHGEIVIQQRTSTPDIKELERLEFILRRDESPHRDSPYDVLLRVFGRHGLMAMGVHLPGMYGPQTPGSRIDLDDNDEIGFPGSAHNIFWLELTDIVSGMQTPRGRRDQANVRDGWTLSWQTADGQRTAPRDITAQLRRWGQVSIGRGVCNPIHIDDTSLREVHAVLQVPGLEEDLGWLAVARPRSAEAGASRQALPDSVEPGHTFRLGDVDFTVDGPRG